MTTEQTSSQRTDKNTSFPFFLILLGVFLLYPIWYRISFNIIFWGYNIFGEMRLAIVLYAVLFRIIVYPFRLLQFSYKDQEKEIDEALEEVDNIKDDYQQKIKRYEVFHKHRNIIIMIFLQFAVMTMIWLTVGRIFIREFTPERIQNELFVFIDEPTFPLQMKNWIPFVGDTDLSVINQKLNFISAIGVGLVGLAEVIIHRKTERMQLIMFLIIFPLGAFLITSQVPSGFEFTMAVFEGFTLMMIPIEKVGTILARRTRQEVEQQFQAQFR